MFVKPGPASKETSDAPDGLLIVRHENRKPLAPEGEDVPESMYWLRRLRDGDVVRAEKPAVKRGELVDDAEKHAAIGDQPVPAMPRPAAIPRPEPVEPIKGATT